MRFRQEEKLRDFFPAPFFRPRDCQSLCQKTLLSTLHIKYLNSVGLLEPVTTTSNKLNVVFIWTRIKSMSLYNNQCCLGV